ncbi:MAG: WecB/TagA/CpsF family glycosyltransferase [Patescibacteria group bacterium]
MVNILGINLSELSPSEVLKKIADFLNDSGQHFIVTPNPEIILAAHQDGELFYILNRADLSLADGVGLKIAAALFGEKVPRVTGADITLEVLKMAAKNKNRVLILNWENSLSQPADITAALARKYPSLIFMIKNVSRAKFLEPALITEINNFAPAIFFNTLGFPYQEKLMYHNISKLPSVKVALGIGGSFDFITNKTKRAPQLLRRLGIEWLWRLFDARRQKNPSARLKRIYRATFVFTGKIIKLKFINPWLYRKNVACFVFKREAGKIKVLILERKDEGNHWQLPQGGTDGESLEVAGRREIQEETGLSDLKTVAKFRNIYHYSFPKIKKGEPYRGSRRYINDYKGQRQGLYVAELENINQEIKICFWDHINYKWVDIDNLVASLHPYRQPGAKIFLKKFKSLNIN